MKTLDPKGETSSYFLFAHNGLMLTGSEFTACWLMHLVCSSRRPGSRRCQRRQGEGGGEGGLSLARLHPPGGLLPPGPRGPARQPATRRRPVQERPVEAGLPRLLGLPPLPGSPQQGPVFPGGNGWRGEREGREGGTKLGERKGGGVD